MTETGDDTKLMAFAEFPEDQRVTLAIEPLPGRMLDIGTVGSMLVNFSKALKAAAKAVGNEKRIFTLAGIRLSDTGRFEADVVELVVLGRKASASTPSTLTKEQENGNG